MPRLTDDNLEQFATTGAFGFSGAKIEDLGATEYTLVGIAVDDSGSVSSFARDLEDSLKNIVQACTFSPRADNLLLRLIKFGDEVEEVNGFNFLSAINGNDYSNILSCNSMTALYDATENIVQSVTDYGKNLKDNDFDVNAIIFVLTDGINNHSTATINSVKKAFAESVQSEALESLVSVLIGIEQDPSLGLDDYLEDFKNDVGFTKYENIGQATPQQLAKLADFISKSISSQSQALGTGGPSQEIVSGSLSI